MNIIDVTLRDGGHAVNFDWPIVLAQKYYDLISKIDAVELIELGYWKQTSKSTNMFYNLDLEKVKNVTRSASRKNVSIMVDYHYCSKNLKDYPDTSQDEIAMIRVCSRKKDITDALIFAQRLKEYTGIKVSFNIFNVSNYSSEELLAVSAQVSKHVLDYVYFADTHGCIDMADSGPLFKSCVKILNERGINAGMHLHDHSGKAYFNYRSLGGLGFSSTDASVRGMGKGVGNLRLEYIVPADDLCHLLNFISDNEELLTMRVSPYGIVTSNYSVTDYYGYWAEKMKFSIRDFDKFCKIIQRVDKDIFNEEIIRQFRK